MLTKEDLDLIQKGFCPTCKIKMKKPNGKLTHSKKKLYACETILRSRRGIKDAYVEQDGKKYDTLNVDGKHYKPILGFRQK